MNYFLLFTIILLIAVPAYWALTSQRKRSRREKLLAKEFPEDWKKILAENFPLYQKLPNELRTKLERHINVFLAEKRFEGCAGLEITDEIRLTIAAPACLLMLNHISDYYPGVSSILVYPSAFVGKDIELMGDSGAYSEGQSTRIGEAWKNDYIVLAWDHAYSGVRNSDDGDNTILHEFAHQLDVADGWFDGTPPLPSQARYRTWTKVLSDEFDTLSDGYRSDTLKKPVLSAYATKNEAEFFAVATEAFFEKPSKLREQHEALYSELRQYYGLDPLQWPK